MTPSDHIEADLSIGGTVRGKPEHVAQALAVDRKFVSEKQAWIEELRARGIKAAHPDDGWVKRDHNKVHLEYPDFDDGLEVGDLLALGWPWRRPYRIVRVTEIEDVGRLVCLRYFHFEEVEIVGEPEKLRAPKRRWWSRKDDASSGASS